MTAASPRSIQDYLDQLRQVLQGADPALMQDALYDAEEHLRAEVAAQPDRPEADVLGSIVSSYGAPEEVAEAYRQNETRVQAALRTPPAVRGRTAWSRFFGVYSDPRAWLALLYMLLSLFSGVFYFTFAATGLSLSVGLAILIIGVPVFLLFIGASRVISLAEGRLVEAMLGTRMPRRPLYPDRGTPWLRRIGEMLQDPRTWGTLLYFALMLPLGVFYFTFAVAGLTISLALTLVPLLVLGWHLGLVQVEGLAGSPPVAVLPLLSILGILLLTFTMHLARGIGHLHGQLAKALLVFPSRSD